jgi:hypothetical protein
MVVSPDDNKNKVTQQGKALAEEEYYPNCTIRSSRADCRVAPPEERLKSEEYEKGMLRPGFEPGISDSKGRYA